MRAATIRGSLRPCTASETLITECPTHNREDAAIRTTNFSHPRPLQEYAQTGGAERVLTQNGAGVGRCRLRSHSLPPLQHDRIWEHASTPTHLRRGVAGPWEARACQSERGDTGGWMNVAALRPIPTRCVRQSWTRVVDRVSSLPGQEHSARPCSGHTSGPAPPAAARPLL